MPTRLDVVTAERVVFSGDIDMVIAPGVMGELGILPRHAPLMTMLQPGELRIKRDNREESLVVTGGFLEVRPDRVIVLADAAERAEEIDVDRAAAAKKRAEERLAQKHAGTLDEMKAEAALRRAIARLRTVEKTRLRRR
ncbi:MAG: F0F1 ATP synthase subunit epsilon [Chloroflexi bacterium]|nr:F0F1 ATP synthase subunit epsilon [Chloroflexota bacterium]